MLWLAPLVGVLRDRQMDRRPQLRSIPQGILKDSVSNPHGILTIALCAHARESLRTAYIEG